MKHLYFAYGSNLSEQRFAARCPSYKFHSVACLKNHAFCFPLTATSFNGAGVAGIKSDAHNEVWGVVYEISPEDLESLDVAEGYSESGPDNSYTRQRTEVLVQPEQSRLEVWTYYPTIEGEHFSPTQDYFQFIKDGLLQKIKHGIPHSYIEQIEALRES